MKTARTIEIEASLTTMVLLAGANGVAAAVSIAIATGALAMTADVRDIMIGAIGTAVFGLGLAIALCRLVMRGGPVVTIAPEGIRDTRVAGEMVPWSAVGKVFTWEDYRQKVMVVAVDSRTERTLTRTWIARMRRDADRRMGAEGLCVTALGLRTSHETLLATTLAYLEAWRSSRSPDRRATS